jgi:hypothetical protein
MDRYGASAALHAGREAKRTRDRRDREIWLAIERAIVERRGEPREAGRVAGW